MTTTQSTAATPGQPAPQQRFDLVLRGERVLTDGGFGPAEVGIRDGRIAAVEPLGTGLDSSGEVIELADDEVLIPGLVDSHVHVNEPGRTEWEGFASATRAAAAGGVTTIIDMPLNSLPPTVGVAALETKQEAARGQCFVDVGFWGGAVPGNTGDLHPLHEVGVFGFKCFLSPSGVPEFPPLEPAEMEADLTELVRDDALLIVHAEDGHVLDQAPPATPGRHYADFLASRPAQAESSAIAAVIEAARRTGGRAHILHLSDAGALPMIAAARADGVRLSVETCPHYLSLASGSVPDGATAYKCCPPIREQSNQDRLWQGLLDGTIDIIVTDHSPSPLDLKAVDTGDFAVAWGGVASLQIGFRVVWTEAHRRGIPLEQVVQWMSAGPADLVGLPGKGRIGVGADADTPAPGTKEEVAVDSDRLHHT
ncbi:MAG: allantoinase AllB, partial [Ornithinimicrobium sp.]|uniref:allantoinase AllB n=1 Tax=Ornithinimicrobium sp. TaxID=1977084 RepID=UPI003D9BBE0E